MLRYMLDTNICIWVLKRRLPQVYKNFSKFSGKMCVSSITVEELQYGIERGAQSRRAEKQIAVDEFLSLLTVLDFDTRAALHSADIRNTLREQGCQIGAYDNLIAAHARSQGLIVATNNVREFERVPGLLIEDWLNVN